jgi:hypothetical protein
VNRILEKTEGRRYLEIGIKKGETFEAVRADLLIGVDPFHVINVATCRPGMSVVPWPSDRYFLRPAGREEFDAIFVDGLHVFRQAYRDILNSAQVLAAGGAIVVDDVIPPNETSSRPERIVKVWTGDVYKAILAVAEHHPELDYRVFRSVLDGHPRAIVWKARPDRETRTVDEGVLRKIDAIGFDAVFAPGSTLGRHFSIVTEDEALEAWQATPAPPQEVGD